MALSSGGLAAGSIRNDHPGSAFAPHDMSAMRKADDREFDQKFSMRAVPRVRHRVCGPVENAAVENICWRDRGGARLHHSLGRDSRRFSRLRFVLRERNGVGCRTRRGCPRFDAAPVSERASETSRRAPLPDRGRMKIDEPVCWMERTTMRDGSAGAVPRQLLTEACADADNPIRLG